MAGVYQIVKEKIEKDRDKYSRSAEKHAMKLAVCIRHLKMNSKTEFQILQKIAQMEKVEITEEEIDAMGFLKKKFSNYEPDPELVEKEYVKDLQSSQSEDEHGKKNTAHID